MDKPTSRRIWLCVKYYLWLCEARGQSPDTIRGKKAGLKKFARWCIAQRIYSADKIDLDLMDDYMAYLNCYRKALDGNPLCLAQKRNLLTFVKTFIEKLYMKELLSTNALQHIELPSKGRALPKALFSEIEIEKILSQSLLFGVLGLRDRAILETFYATGIRRTELMNLDIDDVDLTAHLLRVNRGKGNKDRIVPISKRTCEWITLYLGKIRINMASLSTGSALFLANNGRRYSANKLSEMVARYVKLAGHKRAGACHLFRHATATIMLDNGAELRHVQEMLGHANISTTQIYTHVSRSVLTSTYQRSHPSALSKSSFYL
ncbi:tyrosine-type recombinase/integrase [Pseudoalteromonas sp. KG3]|uniref:tyrosine-type recombinase/integrase n=1 Tax=Pseudoalteromonas sp. KG3 TaxID=2951137 RepID=UPI002658E9A1|nr:tyrosine-type recombinase/integrase [Pseudoalteromonas sp. KG3]WKD26181.1 tyrosine-type recombinase/integrase [Pseudoalteromonas sp. KG3]